MGRNRDPELLPFWQVNVPPEDREVQCPEYLRGLSQKDIAIIGTRDEDYHVQTWEEVVDIVRKNRLSDFKRWPSELRRYREFVWRLKRDEGSVMEYVLRERLRWTQPIVPRSRQLFAREDDYKILFNDWPYGVDSRIVHLVVWTKFVLEDNREAEAEIAKFIKRVFLSKVPRDKLVWFKNPPSLKSVHAVEHFHVMLFDPDPELVRLWTKGDRPHGRLLRGAKGQRR